MAFRSAITVSLVPEARGGPFVFWDGLADACARAGTLGFDAIEIFPRSIAELDPGEVRRLLDQHHLKLAAMGTGAGWVVQKLRLTDPDPAIRKRAIEFAATVVDFAGKFGAPAIIGSMQGRVEGAASRDQVLGWLAEALEQLGPRAEALGTPVLFEPLNRYETNVLNRVPDTLGFLSGLRTKNVKLLCDLFHMNIEEADIAGALRQAGSRLGHIHFVDTNRLAVGFGHLDSAPIIKALRELDYSGYLSAEIIPSPDSATAAAQTHKAFSQWLCRHPD